MKIDLGNFTIETNPGQDLNSRVFVRRIMSGYGIALNFQPYKAYLVEKNVYGDLVRDIIFLPGQNTENWLDDYIQGEDDRENVIVLGCIELKDIELPEYVPPVEYRAKKEKEAKMWEEINKND
jgi:hypothetical protein